MRAVDSVSTCQESMAEKNNWTSGPLNGSSSLCILRTSRDSLSDSFTYTARYTN